MPVIGELDMAEAVLVSEPQWMPQYGAASAGEARVTPVAARRTTRRILTMRFIAVPSTQLFRIGGARTVPCEVGV